MKRLLGIIIGLFLIGCEDTRIMECDECVLDIYSSNLQESDEGVYFLEYNQDLAQTYTMLEATTECGWSQHLQWEEFIGHTVTVYCGYTDNCGVHHLDSLKIEIVNNE